ERLEAIFNAANPSAAVRIRPKKRAPEGALLYCFTTNLT
ncbi:MAG: hypothetical protein ACI87H_003725, partial [Gammaproteobacteria bacterium]